jgi:hypothetical protein
LRHDFPASYLLAKLPKSSQESGEICPPQAYAGDYPAMSEPLFTQLFVGFRPYSGVGPDLMTFPINEHGIQASGFHTH